MRNKGVMVIVGNPRFFLTLLLLVFFAFLVFAVPSIDTITLTATNASNDTFQNLSLSITASGGNDFVNITRWVVNNQSLLVLNYPIENATSSSTLEDYSGNGQDGTLVGATFFPTGGHDGHGRIYFDGSNDYVTIPSTLVTPMGQYTVEAWIQVNESGNGNIITHDRNNLDISPNKHFEIKMVGTALYGSWEDTSGSTDAIIIYNDYWDTYGANWTHVALSVDATGVGKLYVNGGVVGSAWGFPTTTNNDQVLLGAIRTSASSGEGTFFNGSISLFRLWNQSLGQEQIATLAQGNELTFVAEETTTNNLIQGCAFVHNGTTNSSEQCSEPITISAQVNSLPTLSDVQTVATATSNNSAQNLSASFTSADTDGDAIENITTWNFNGSSLLLLDLPFTAQDGEEHRFTRDYAQQLNGTVQGAIFNSTAGHASDGAYLFDGTQSMLTIPHNFSLQSEEYSIAVWLKPATLTGTQAIISKSGMDIDVLTENNVVYQLFLTNGVPAFFAENNAGVDFSLNANTTLSTSEFSHVVVTVPNDGGTVRMYINGQQNASSGIGFTTNQDNTQPVRIGWAYSVGNDNATFFYNGTLSDLRIYNRTLSAAQVLSLYQQEEKIVSTETAVDDIWQACVVPNDGKQDGIEYCGDNVTINAIREVTLESPIEGYVNNSNYYVNVTFNCTAADELALANISLYLSNRNSLVPLLNQTTNVSGAVNASSWELELYRGNYTWTCGATNNQSISYFASENRTLILNYTLDTFPFWSANSSSIVSTYNGSPSSFSIVWNDTNDNANLATVYLESNYSGTPTNYSMTQVSGNSSNGIFNYSIVLPAGNHYWTSYAIDGAGQTNQSDQWNFSIGQGTSNVNLTLNGSVENITINAGGLFTYNCSLITGENSLSVLKDDSSFSTGTSPVSGTTYFMTTGIHNITCQHSLSQNYTASSVILFANITNNTAPSVTNPVLTPSTVYTNSSITTNVTYTDTDGDLGNVTFTWYVNGSSIYNQTNSSLASGVTVISTLGNGNFSKGELVNVTVTAVDTINSSDPVNSSTITIADSAVFLNITLANQTLNVGSSTTVNLSLYFADVDNDAINYTVSENSSAITTSVSSEILTITGAASGTGTYQVNASSEDTSALSNTVTVTVNTVASSGGGGGGGSSSRECTLDDDCETNEVCYNYQCFPVACYSDTDCGTKTISKTAYCQDDAVQREFVVFSCYQPGTRQATCVSGVETEISETCTFACSNGNCVDQPVEEKEVEANETVSAAPLIVEQQKQRNWQLPLTIIGAILLGGLLFVGLVYGARSIPWQHKKELPIISHERAELQARLDVLKYDLKKSDGNAYERLQLTEHVKRIEQQLHQMN